MLRRLGLVDPGSLLRVLAGGRFLLLQLFQLLKKVGRLEVLGDRIVQSRNDLVDRFLPRLFRVFAALDCLEELPERLFHHESEIGGNLQKKVSSLTFTLGKNARHASSGKHKNDSYFMRLLRCRWFYRFNDSALMCCV